MDKVTEQYEILTIEEVAEMLRVDDRTLYRKVEHNQIPHFRVGGTGAIRFVKDKIIKWIDEQHKS
jgi:excisionase family DNA binding protein